MSSIAFGAMMRKRQEAAKDKSQDEEPPGIKTYADTLTALVPAEVLAAHAAVLSATTDTEKVDGTDQTVVTDPTALKIAFWVLAAASVLFYVAGFQKRRWSAAATVGLIVPPAAFMAWTASQTTSGFTAVFPDLSQGERDVIVILAALVLGLIATAVPVVLAKSPAKK